MTLAIVIVSFNARADLERCVASLTMAPPKVAHEIVVVDNASTDGSVDAIRGRWPSLHVIAHDENLGFARANNAGIRATQSDLILLLNSDTIVPPGAVDALVSTLVETPRAAAAGPRLVDATGTAELSFGRMMGPVNEFRQKLLVTASARRLWPAMRLVDRMTRRAHVPDWVSGACLLVWRRDAEAVGLLDERYFMYAEDVDFCAALRARGRSILFVPGVEVVHARGKSRAVTPEATQAAYRRSQVAFYQKHHPGWAPLLRWYLHLRGKLPAA
jgi:N-acetylglucosaminyl-diphospho-decaprenol L-rhamnosyltransferase